MFFIVGSARSGTTLLRIMLNAHPQVAVPPESRFITELWHGRDEVDVDEFLTELRDHRQFKVWDLPTEDVRRELPEGDVSYAQAIEATYKAYAHQRDKNLYGDKTPRYVEHIRFLTEQWPDAKFIHQIRDGRNVALSYADVPFGPKDVAGAARLWEQRVRDGMRDGRPLGPERYMEIRYEDFVSDIESQSKLICDFLEISFDEAMLDYTERARDDILPRAAKYNPNVSKPVSKKTRAWEEEMPSAQVELFEAIAGDLLAEMGYDRSFTKPGARARMLASVSKLGVPVGRLHGTRTTASK